MEKHTAITKREKKSEWKKIKLADADIINLVNLRFISNHYGYSADKVIKMRSEGRNFVVINDNIKKEKRGRRTAVKGKAKNKNHNDDLDDYKKDGK